MSPRPTRRDQEERRRLFQRMEWFFVYLPPLLIAFIAGFGAIFLAWLIPFPGTTFWQRWLVLVLVMVGIPLLLHGIRWLWERNRP